MMNEDIGVLAVVINLYSLGLRWKMVRGDLKYRPTAFTHKNSSNATISSESYTYDNVGNRTVRDEDGERATFTYDNAYRLTGQQLSGAWSTFVYDDTGNILVKAEQGSGPRTYTYDAANRMMTMATGGERWTYVYDDNGSLTGEQMVDILDDDALNTTNAYDNENRLLSVKSHNGSAFTVVSTYTYDGDGLRRSEKDLGGALTTLIWDGREMLQERT